VNQVVGKVALCLRNAIHKDDDESNRRRADSRDDYIQDGGGQRDMAVAQMAVRALRAMATAGQHWDSIVSSKHAIPSLVELLWIDRHKADASCDSKSLVRDILLI